MIALNLTVLIVIILIINANPSQSVSKSSVTVTQYQRVPSAVYANFYRTHGQASWLKGAKIHHNAVPISHFHYDVEHPAPSASRWSSVGMPPPTKLSTTTFVPLDVDIDTRRQRPFRTKRPGEGTIKIPLEDPPKKPSSIAFPMDVKLAEMGVDYIVSKPSPVNNQLLPIPNPAHVDSSPIVFPGETNKRPVTSITQTPVPTTEVAPAEETEAELEDKELAEEFWSWIKGDSKNTAEDLKNAAIQFRGAAEPRALPFRQQLSLLLQSRSSSRS